MRGQWLIHALFYTCKHIKPHKHHNHCAISLAKTFPPHFLENFMCLLPIFMKLYVKFDWQHLPWKHIRWGNHVYFLKCFIQYNNIITIPCNLLTKIVSMPTTVMNVHTTFIMRYIYTQNVHCIFINLLTDDRIFGWHQVLRISTWLRWYPNVLRYA